MGVVGEQVGHGLVSRQPGPPAAGAGEHLHQPRIEPCFGQPRPEAGDETSGSTACACRERRDRDVGREARRGVLDEPILRVHLFGQPGAHRPGCRSLCANDLPPNSGDLWIARRLKEASNQAGAWDHLQIQRVLWVFAELLCPLKQVYYS